MLQTLVYNTIMYALTLFNHKNTVMVIANLQIMPTFALRKHRGVEQW